jgi:predicted flap endonuclease-1-like 5' DNA nuclease
MRWIFMILGAVGAMWWLRQREKTELAERQEQLPTGVRLIPDSHIEEEKPTPPAKVQAAIAASAEVPAPPPEASIAAVKTVKPKPSVPAKPGKGQKGDDFTVLNGIGKVFAQRLNDAGIRTFADLANQSPDKLREITGAKEWQKVDPQAWIDQAKRRAQYGE